MSIYSLASRTLIPGKWGGEEVLLFLRYEWSLNVTVLHPTFEYKLGHNMSVKNSHLVLAHNGQDHYMPCGKTYHLSFTLLHLPDIYFKLTISIHAFCKNSL